MVEISLPLGKFILLKEIDAYHFVCVRILPVDCRAFFIVSKPDQTAEAQELCFFGGIIYSAVVKLVVGLYTTIIR